MVLFNKFHYFFPFSFAKNIGVANSNLTYYYGILKLVYKDGDNYRSNPPAPRMTVITFLCDMKDKIGHPQFIEESNMTYWFSWYTQYACTSPPVECTFTDEMTKKQYDLSQYVSFYFIIFFLIVVTILSPMFDKRGPFPIPSMMTMVVLAIAMSYQ